MTTVDAPRPLVTPGEAELPTGPQLWRTQIRSVVGLELRRSLLSRRGLGLYLLAAVPVAVTGLIAVLQVFFAEMQFDSLEDARQYFAEVFQILILRMILYFGCIAVFSSLIRGEVLQRSLHYYLLCAIRRPVLVVAKYLAGLAHTSILFVGAVTVSYLMVYVPLGFRQGAEDFLQGPGFAHLLAYLGITILACVGYGALFLTIGVLIRNPVLPAILLFGWELLHHFLPPTLKLATVVHYLMALAPIPSQLPLIAVISDPPPAILSVLGLLVFAAAVVSLGAWMTRKMEIKYGDD